MSIMTRLLEMQAIWVVVAAVITAFGVKLYDKISNRKADTASATSVLMTSSLDYMNHLTERIGALEMLVDRQSEAIDYLLSMTAHNKEVIEEVYKILNKVPA